MQKPFLIVVTGPPGSGKTTLAHRLAQRIHCPTLCRDEFKEGLVHTLRSDHASLGREINGQLYKIFFNTVNFVLAQRISIVIEAAFQHKLWAPQLAPLAEVANVCILICTVLPEIARERCLKRSRVEPARERFHGDSTFQSAQPTKTYIPPNMPCPTLTVDTTAGYTPNLEQVVAFALQTTSTAQTY